jgi:hypothetical protein
MPELMDPKLQRRGTFRRDVRAALELDPTTFGEVVATVRSVMLGEEVTTSPGVSPEDPEFDRAIRVCSYLRVRSIRFGLQPAESLEQLGAFVSKIGMGKSFESHRDELASLFEYTDDERLGLISERASAFGASYHSSFFAPVFLTSEDMPTRLFPALQWILSYHDANRDHEDLSLVMTPNDARELIKDLTKAVETLTGLAAKGQLQAIHIHEDKQK